MQNRLIFNKTEVAQLLITKKADTANFATNQLFLRKRCDFFIYRSNKSDNHHCNF